MKQVVVIIPIYKTKPNDYEKISWERCLNVLQKHPITVVTHTDLDLSWYKDYNNINFEFFDKDFFANIQGYNRLMLSTDFYKRFKDYEYILIYQLDAYVFKDELLYWCDKGYDYIGAPWIGQEWAYNLGLNGTKLRQLRNKIKKPKKVKVVGNGGFSLRKIKTFIFLNSLFRKRISKLPYDFNEDIFWGLIMPSYYPFFRIPTNEIALQFSFEVFPTQCFALNNLKLPFGCHAWEKYEIEFWKNFISF